jgi:hypothetical protein
MPLVDLKVHRRARWKLDELPESERNAIMEAAESLRGLSAEQWPMDRVQEVDAKRGVYLLAVGPMWRVFIDRAPTGDLEIGDVTTQDVLDAFRNSGRKNGKKKA